MKQLALALLLVCNAAYAELLAGKVVGITDGDTVTLLDTSNQQHKVRLAGIDAPESGQPFGEASRQSLAKLAFGKAVMVEHHKRDRWGRLVGKIFVLDQDICLEQVRLGMAWHYKAFQREQTPSDRSFYAIAEAKARKDRIGLWKDSSPVPPWDWRSKK